MGPLISTMVRSSVHDNAENEHRIELSELPESLVKNLVVYAPLSDTDATS